MASSKVPGSLIDQTSDGVSSGCWIAEVSGFWLWSMTSSGGGYFRDNKTERNVNDHRRIYATATHPTASGSSRRTVAATRPRRSDACTQAPNPGRLNTKGLAASTEG
jgi:hypothetical protein